MAACVDQCLHDEPGKPMSTKFIKGKDAINFVTVRVEPAPCDRCESSIDKGAENAVFYRVGLLLVVVIPDLFDEGEFGLGKLAGKEGGWWKIHFCPGGRRQGRIQVRINEELFIFSFLHRFGIMEPRVKSSTPVYPMVLSLLQIFSQHDV